jgi:hypothetical protein
MHEACVGVQYLGCVVTHVGLDMAACLLSPTSRNTHALTAVQLTSDGRWSTSDKHAEHPMYCPTHHALSLMQPNSRVMEQQVCWLAASDSVEAPLMLHDAAATPAASMRRKVDTQGRCCTSAGTEQTVLALHTHHV